MPQADLPPGTLANIALTVRAVDRPSAIAKSVAAAVEDVNRDVALTIVPLSDQVNASLTQERMTASLAVLFGALALVLAGLGLYGVTAYAVARRRVEFGIRMALGATTSAAVRLVVSHVMLVVVIGVAAGAASSMCATRFVASLLYGLPPRDPVTLMAAAGIPAVTAAVAAGLPAFRASRIDPAEVLRDS